jgi:hypothetical protein
LSVFAQGQLIGEMMPSLDIHFGTIFYNTVLPPTGLDGPLTGWTDHRLGWMDR